MILDWSTNFHKEFLFNFSPNQIIDMISKTIILFVPSFFCRFYLIVDNSIDADSDWVPGKDLLEGVKWR